jgi:hypothetical protein
MTMISESVASLLSEWAIAIISAIGAMIRISCGMTRPVMPTKTRIFCPWLVMMSMSRKACVTQITAVRLSRMIKNAPNVVRKMYQPIEPIIHATPATPTGGWSVSNRPVPKSFAGAPKRSATAESFDLATKWPSQGASKAPWPKFTGIPNGGLGIGRSNAIWKAFCYQKRRLRCKRATTGGRVRAVEVRFMFPALSSLCRNRLEKGFGVQL